MKILVTGAAGFIGSNLCDFLLTKNHSVLGIDNFSTGKKEFLCEAKTNRNFSFQELDLHEQDKLNKVTKEFLPDTIIHLAANADVRFGLEHPRKDLEQGTLLTFHALEAARYAGVKQFAFASTGSVYGEPEIFPTPENCPFPIQTSLYGASKLAGEALVQAYAEGYGIRGVIYRFVSILGERYTHGHIIDFAKKLRNNPAEIEVLGNGKQKKAYLYVGDCVRAMLQILEQSSDKVSIYNLGPDEFIDVNQSLSVICRELKVWPHRKYTGGERGWTGDSPFIFLDNKKLKTLGWKAEKSIEESVSITLNYLQKNDWLWDREIKIPRQDKA